MTAVQPSTKVPAFSAELAATLSSESLAWHKASDFRGFLLAGRALLLQVAHPTVGAGVSEHSDFQADPWGRLIRTLDFLNGVLYSDDAVGVANRMRAMHKTIKGVKPDGTRYHAMEPEAFTWVHATLVESMAAANQAFGKRMSLTELDRFYDEMRGVGALYGVRERDLPENWKGFMEYYDWMIDERLENNDSVQDVLSTMGKPSRPHRAIPRGLWIFAMRPASKALWVGTMGLIPARLRAKFGAEWTQADERLLRVMKTTARGVDPILPESLKVFGPSYLKLRGRYGPPVLGPGAPGPA